MSVSLIGAQYTTAFHKDSAYVEGTSTGFTDVDAIEKRFEDIRAKTSNLKADNAPENLWGKIVVGGQVMAEVYKSGVTTYYGNGQLNINTDASPSDIAKQIMKQIGGQFQPGPAQSGRSEMYL